MEPTFRRTAPQRRIARGRHTFKKTNARGARGSSHLHQLLGRREDAPISLRRTVVGISKPSSRVVPGARRCKAAECKSPGRSSGAGARWAAATRAAVCTRRIGPKRAAVLQSELSITVDRAPSDFSAPESLLAAMRVHAPGACPMRGRRTPAQGVP